MSGTKEKPTHVTVSIREIQVNGPRQLMNLCRARAGLPPLPRPPSHDGQEATHD